MRVKFRLLRILLILALSIFIVSCSNQEQKTEITSLLIDNSDMPANWPFSEFSNIGIDKDRSRDSVAISFNSDLYPDTFSSIQNVYRFNSVFTAKQDYLKELEFYKRYYYLPPEWNYTSDKASESNIFCKKNTFVICVWMARYEDIVIELQVSIIPSRMSFDDMENIVKKIDARAIETIITPP